MDNYYIEDVCTLINNYIEERSGALNKLTDVRMGKVAEIDQKINELKPRAANLPKARTKMKELEAQKIAIMKKNINDKSGYTAYNDRANAVNAKTYEQRANEGKGNYIFDTDNNRYRSTMKKALGQGSAPQERQPGYYLKQQQMKDKTNGVTRESVETKLNIYEAYDNGHITESEKNDLLLMVEKATVSKKKQKILDNQDELKENFNEISGDLKKMVVSNAGDIKLEMTDKKFFRNHEDHKEQHYLLEYSLNPSDDTPKSKVSSILLSIGNNVEKDFKKDKKDFLDKGLYFDNKKKDDMTRFVELHYDFY